VPVMWQRIRDWARQLKAETLALWFCCKHPDTPLSAKILATLVVAYALSPIDLIPDFIPVIGYLDDVILIPIGIYFTLKLVPRQVLEECRAKARDWIAAQHPKPRNYVAAAIIVAVWVLALWIVWRWTERFLLRG
jgi:uncharacterized membrane protein YkvA (DUF1232 family)